MMASKNVLQRYLDRGLDEDRNPQQVVGANHCTRSYMIAYADDPVDTTPVLTVQIEIELLSDAWHDREAHSAERLTTCCLDNVTFDRCG
jgi:hypothetical protein